MRFKERPKGEPDSEPVERDDVHVAANRCPFCHDDVAAAQSVACQGCLARHHDECWAEHGCCAACEEERKLVGEVSPALADGAREGTQAREDAARLSHIRRTVSALRWLAIAGPLIVSVIVFEGFPGVDPFVASPIILTGAVLLLALSVLLQRQAGEGEE